MTGYDIIGDVHGCADKLEGLLGTLGYQLRSGVYGHSERRAVFVGDLIDRGDQQVETLKLVRAMVEAGLAEIVMGNHEFNAISYATPNPGVSGEFMRPHNEKNRSQHAAFIEQVSFGSRLHSETIEWFKTLPIYRDLGDLRIVHACWTDKAIKQIGGWLESGSPMPHDFVIRANEKGTDEYDAIEVLLKGPEVDLRNYGQPDFKIPGDKVRHEARIRWWKTKARTLSELADLPPGTTTAAGEPYPELPPEQCDGEREFAYRDGVPVCYGHYWRVWSPREGEDWTSKTACVDFSAVGGGPLVAYRWSGESEIHPENYVRWPDDERSG